MVPPVTSGFLPATSAFPPTPTPTQPPTPPPSPPPTDDIELPEELEFLSLFHSVSQFFVA